MCSKFYCKKVFKNVNNNKYNFDQLDRMLNKCNKCININNNNTTQKTRNAIGQQYSRLFFSTSGGKNQPYN